MSSRDSSRAKISSILEAAASLFGDRPPSSVRMEEVARLAGVAKGTLYNYFASKKDLVRALLSSHLDELADGLEIRSGDDWETQLHVMVDHAFRFQLRSGDWFRMRRRAASDREIAQLLREKEGRVLRAFSGVLEEAAIPGREPRRDAALILGTVDAAVLRCLEAGADSDGASREAGELWHFVRSAIGARTAEGSSNGRPSPLAGRVVMITREEDEDGPLSRSLAELGANVVRVPLLRTHSPEDPGELEREAGRLEFYDWVVFTSARAARALAEVVPRGAPWPRIAVVGEGTAKECRSRGLAPSLIGSSGVANLVERMAETGLMRTCILFPLADRASHEGIDGLARAGARVVALVAYRTVPCPDAAARLREALHSAAPDAVAFTSPSAVEVFAEAAPDVPSSMRFAAIGASTARALESRGLSRIVMPRRPGFAALAEALAEEFSR